MAGKNSSRNSTPKSGKKRRFKLSDAVLIAIISAITTIVVAVINNNAKDPQNVVITTTQAIFTQTESATMTFTEKFDATAPVFSLTDTLQPSLPLTTSPSNTSTATLTPKPNPTNTFTAISPSQNDRMIGSLVLSIDEGKAPLKVNFDARDSTYHFANGTTAVCRNEQFCSFTFLIRLGSQQVYGETNANGTLEYNFTKKGVYTVVVNVCRENVCDLETATVNIR